MPFHYFIHALFAGAGIVALLAAIFNWQWFFRTDNARFIVQTFGRRGSRWFYGIVGIALIGLAYYFETKT